MLVKFWLKGVSFSCIILLGSLIGERLGWSWEFSKTCFLSCFVLISPVN